MVCRARYPCIIQGCTRDDIKGRGLCQLHYDRDFRARTNKGEKERINNKRPKVRYKRAIGKARNRGLSFTASFELFMSLLQMGCYYCGTDLMPLSGGSLDRIDNDKGYEPNNVLPCCGVCNIMRGASFTVEESKVMVSALLKHRKFKAKNSQDNS